MNREAVGTPLLYLALPLLLPLPLVVAPPDLQRTYSGAHRTDTGRTPYNSETSPRGSFPDLTRYG